MCLELLQNHLHEGAKVLDVGSGSGYLTAIFGKAVGSTGKVIGIDIYEDLVEKAKSKSSASPFRLLYMMNFS